MGEIDSRHDCKNCHIQTLLFSCTSTINSSNLLVLRTGLPGEERVKVGERRIGFATNELFGRIDGAFYITRAWMQSSVKKFLLSKVEGACRVSFHRPLVFKVTHNSSHLQ